METIDGTCHDDRNSPSTNCMRVHGVEYWGK